MVIRPGDFILKGTMPCLQGTDPVNMTSWLAMGGEDSFLSCRKPARKRPEPLLKKYGSTVENYTFEDEKNIYKVTISIGVQRPSFRA